MFEEAADFGMARRMLIETPVALPTIYMLAGVRTGEAYVIERLPQGPRHPRPRGGSERLGVVPMGRATSWPRERRAAVSNAIGQAFARSEEAASGVFLAQGIEAGKPATTAPTGNGVGPCRLDGTAQRGTWYACCR